MDRLSRTPERVARAGACTFPLVLRASSPRPLLRCSIGRRRRQAYDSKVSLGFSGAGPLRALQLVSCRSRSRRTRRRYAVLRARDYETRRAVPFLPLIFCPSKRQSINLLRRIFMNIPSALLVSALVAAGSSGALGQSSTSGTAMTDAGTAVTPSTTGTAKHRHHHHKHHRHGLAKGSSVQPAGEAPQPSGEKPMK